MPKQTLDRSFVSDMQFKFPLPPATLSSPSRSLRSIDAFSAPSNPFDTGESSHGHDSAPSSGDPARIHPIFINSDLNDKAKILHLPTEAYPADRLNPVCMGYFNHSEYEAAMSSIMVAEAMYQSSTGYAGQRSSRSSLQHRRSMSMLSSFA